MVKVSKDKAEFLLNQKFEKLVTSFSTRPHFHSLHEFFGDVNEVTIAQISDVIEDVTNSKNLSKSTIKRVFAIAIEGLQNIYRHALRNENGESTGAFGFYDFGDVLELHFLNLIGDEGVIKMQNFCKTLSSLSLEETKGLYMKTLSTSEMTDKGGASLGCMLMKLKSDGNLGYNIESFSPDISCYHFIVIVKK